MKFSPTNRVRVTQTIYDSMTLAVIATRGTIGRVISFEEYCDYRHWDKDGRGFPEQAKEDFNDGSMCPIKIEWFAPLEPADDPRNYDPGVVILDYYNRIVVVTSRTLELVEPNPQEAQPNRPTN